MSRGRELSSETAAKLAALRADVADRVAALRDRHAARLQCRRGCSGCCQDALRVTEVEADSIRRAYPHLLSEEEPAPVGACAFLDSEGACRVYAERPLVCRTQGLPLRVFFEDSSDEVVEQRDICPLNLEGGPALESLDADECWLVGPDELRLFSINESHCGDGESRIALRSLFASPRSPRD